MDNFEARQKMKLNTASKLILLCLSASRPLTLEDLMAQTGLSAQYVFVRLSDLSKHGLVIKQRLREVTTYILADADAGPSVLADAITMHQPSFSADFPA
jgi:DNA-binding MarR family transcriptional regulator